MKPMAKTIAVTVISGLIVWYVTQQLSPRKPTTATPAGILA